MVVLVAAAPTNQPRGFGVLNVELPCQPADSGIKARERFSPPLWRPDFGDFVTFEMDSGVPIADWPWVSHCAFRDSDFRDRDERKLCCRAVEDDRVEATIELRGFYRTPQLVNSCWKRGREQLSEATMSGRRPLLWAPVAFTIFFAPACMPAVCMPPICSQSTQPLRLGLFEVHNVSRRPVLQLRYGSVL